jgi:hypothetical protein
MNSPHTHVSLTNEQTRALKSIFAGIHYGWERYGHTTLEYYHIDNLNHMYGLPIGSPYTVKFTKNTVVFENEKVILEFTHHYFFEERIIKEQLK